ncbi:uncharacterized protein LOC130614338 [Hydractinia symbiolongicarpus]|uniref:uncharacterized protein LOC130614338 n=1 Tax=Hydractinia symbiolongicarpus TaxID=13093 RepID=UPI0025508A5D|nr:uncharacterized protein LOC130614338 [Hydractinia symbiolongicarpus]
MSVRSQITQPLIFRERKSSSYYVPTTENLQILDSRIDREERNISSQIDVSSPQHPKNDTTFVIPSDINKHYSKPHSSSSSNHSTKSRHFFNIDDIPSDASSSVNQHSYKDQTKLLPCLNQDKSQNKSRYQPIDKFIDDLIEGQETIIEDANAITTARVLRWEYGSRNLPVIDLFRFDGSPNKWPEFVENFKSTVHLKVSFDDNTRMERLISVLDDEAKKTVLSIGASGILYASALKALKRDFGNPVVVSYFKIKNVLDLPKIPPRDRTSLRRYQQLLNSNNTWLISMGYKSAINSTDNLAKAVARLPHHFRNQFNKFSKGKIANQEQNKIKNGKESKRDEKRVRTFATGAGSERSTKCWICSENHFVFKCREFESKPVADRRKTAKQNENEDTKNEPEARITRSLTTTDTYLQVIPVTVTHNNKSVTTNAILDSGSDSTLICEETARKLGLEEIRIEKAWVVPDLNTPTKKRNITDLKEKYVHLKDIDIPTLNDDKVTVLIKIDTPSLHIQHDYRVGKHHEPVAVKTQLGWILLGGKNKNIFTNINRLETDTDDLTKAVERFWEIESYGTKPPLHPDLLTKDEKHALHILKSTTKMKDGHFEVGLLWKDEKPKLPYNRELAAQRLKSNKRKLSKQPILAENYRLQVKEYIALGHARKLSDFEKTKHPISPTTYHIMVKVSRIEQDALRFVWRENTSDNIDDFAMQVHLFGKVGSPCCANYALRQTSVDHDSEIVDAITKRFYMDDYLDSMKTVDEAVSIAKTVTEALKRCGFRLTKWLSNFCEILKCFPNTETVINVDLDLNKLPTERVLGMLWNPYTDYFTFKVVNKPSPETKRDILSLTSSIFDPLGILTPFIQVDSTTYFFRRFNQCIWCCRISTYSRYAYRQCNIRDGKIQSRPLNPKSLTIPKLELQAAVLATRMRESIVSSLSMDLSTKFWTDSQIVLKYISNENRKFPVFVTNRINEIRATTDVNSWRFVPGTLNPADNATRYVPLSSTENSRWLTGPSFLIEEECNWPDQNQNVIQSEEDADITNFQSTSNAIPEKTSFIKWESYSDWQKLCRHIAWIIKLKRNWLLLKKGGSEREKFDYLIVDEIEATKLKLYSISQIESYPSEFENLQSHKELPKRSPLAALRPMMQNNLIRVGGRIGLIDIPFESKHQVIISPKDHIARLIIQHIHHTNFHVGQNATLAVSRQNIWIPTGKSFVKNLKNACEPPFNRSGVDFFGPMILKRSKRTRASSGIVKRYGVLFTCMTSRAVHIELAGDLSTDSFILALRRFISRRGNPKTITSDNGTNFVGPDRELRELVTNLNETKLQKELTKNSIEWKFNPPFSPWMNGAMESMVKITKRVLKAIVRDRVLTEEELHLNDRKRWRAVQAASNMFWNRWRKEYLPSLTTRAKWNTNDDQIKEGDLVIVRDQNVLKNHWPLGRIAKIFPGSDGINRVAEVKTADGNYIRPIRSLALLERSAK